MTFKQGELDGLCGLYGLINFIVRKNILPDNEDKQGREAFRYMLESAEYCGHLTAHRLHDGYEWPLLMEIFNDWATRYCEPYQAVPLSAVSKLQKRCTTETAVGSVIDAEGAALLSVMNGRHWILAVEKNEQGKYLTEDSHANSPERPRSKFDSLECGIALLPQGEFLDKINAQTH